MTAPLSRAASRMAALGLLGLMVLVLGGVAFLPISAALDGGKDEAQASLTLLAAYERAAAARPALEAELAALKKREQALPGLAGGASTALAAAGLQAEMKQIVESHRGEIRSVQNLPPVAAEGFDRIDIRYEVQLPMQSLGDVLYQIETHTPYLFIDKLDMHAPENWRPDAPAAAEPRLSVQWNVHAYRRVAAP